MYVLINPNQHPSLKRIITDTQYYILSYSDKQLYTKETIDEDNTINDILDTVSIGLSVSSLFDSDSSPSSDSSDSSFSGFDGGDTGGGGAGGDW